MVLPGPDVDTAALDRRAWLFAAVGAAVSQLPVRAQGMAEGSIALLRVDGAVRMPLVLTAAQLGSLPWRDYSEVREVRQGESTARQAVAYRGLPLRELLDMAQLLPDRHAVRRTVFLLTASDGYRVSFSWGELFNSSLGEGVILVRVQDGRDLIEVDGFVALRSLHDSRPGPRHVRKLTRVEVLVPGG